jgi:hypothetical protein
MEWELLLLAITMKIQIDLKSDGDFFDIKNQ